MNRRAFVSLLAASPFATARDSQPIIDAHTHFYDPSRPSGVPWPGKDEELLYRTVLPREFVALTQPIGVAGTIVVEASPWLEDNQWILDLAKDNPVITGFIGHLRPGEPDFTVNLDRFIRNPIFRGIRLNGTALTESGDRPAFFRDLARVADAGLTLDVIGGPDMLAGVAALADRVPNLKIVIDHLPFEPFFHASENSAYRSGLHLLSERRNIYAKISGVLRKGVGPSGATLRIDKVWRTFGEDRVLFASNWPVSNLAAPYHDVYAVVDAYLTAKGRTAREKFFWKNSAAAYQWLERGSARRP